MPSRTFLFAALFGASVAAALALRPRPESGTEARAYSDAEIIAVAQEIDRSMERVWTEVGRTPTAPASELAIYRRMTLALESRIPSLSEIRSFEADPRPDRLDRALDAILGSERFAESFAARWSLWLAGTDGLPEIVYRGDRLRAHLSHQIRARRPYAEIVRQLVVAEGLWTGAPATNFLTAGVRDARIAPNVLTARLSRAFLGQHLDCAECHDHPFTHWTRADFAGLAGFFGETELSVLGVTERPGTSTVGARVPFGAEWLPSAGTRRVRLADWLVHRENRRFHRAAANRLFAILFGRPWQVPIDDLPDPEPTATGDALDLLADDFRAHGTDLSRAIRVLARTRAFRLDSAPEPPSLPSDPDPALMFAAFPLTPLRPEQLAASGLQLADLGPPERDPNLLARIIHLTKRLEFITAYGDKAGEVSVEPPATVTQTLFWMNGAVPSELFKVGLVQAGGQIAALARSNDDAIDALALLTFTRHATDDERRELGELLGDVKGKEREHRIEDLLWSLTHSAEFTWNH